MSVDQKFTEFQVRVRDENHDCAVRRAYRLLSELVDALPAGTHYGIDNDEDGTPYIYVSQEAMTPEKFEAMVEAAGAAVSEDEAISFLFRKTHELALRASDLIDEGATDEKIASELMPNEDVETLRACIDRITFFETLERLSPKLVPRFQGVIAAIHTLKAKRRLGEPTN